MDFSWAQIWKEIVFLILHLTGTMGRLDVTVEDKVIGNKGDTVTLPCSFHGNSDNGFSMKWIDPATKRDVYVYREGSYDAPVASVHDTNENMQRYSRNGLHLVIRSLKQSDRGVKCCVIKTYDPADEGTACTKLNFIDFSSKSLECRDKSGPLESFTTLHTRDSHLRVNCSYNKIFPQADIVLYQNGVTEPLESVMRNASVEDGGQFSLSMNIDRKVRIPGTYIIHATDKEDVDRRFIIRMQDPSGSSSPRLVCYYPYWAVYRDEPLLAAGVPVEYCTHIIWAFVSIGENNVAQPSTSEEFVQLQRLLSLKRRRPDLKILGAIGGANNADYFTQIVKSEADMMVFAETCLKYVKDNGLDGLDVAWSLIPALLRDKFTSLLKAIRLSLDSEPDANYVLTTVIGADKDVLEKSFDLKEISKIVDVTQLAAYDIHGHWDESAGHLASLHPQGDNMLHDSVDWIINRFIELGGVPAKTTIGIPFYGRSYQLCDPADHHVGADICGRGEAQPVSATAGIAQYSEICVNVLVNGWTEEHDNVTRATYAYKGDQWVTYESTHSVREKVKYARSKGVSGVYVWQVSQDDVTNKCQAGHFILLKTLAEELGTARDIPSVLPLPGITETPVMVCNFPGVAARRPLPFTFTTDDVPIQYCTHIIWSFITIGKKLPWPILWYEKEQMQSLLALKRMRPELKVLASVGGGTTQNEFTQVMATRESINTFVVYVRRYLWMNQLDGIDVAWLDPQPQLKEQFTMLIKAFRKALNEEQRVKYLLSVTISSHSASVVDKAVDILEISIVSDLINIAAYDFHGAGADTTGFQAALYHHKDSWPQSSQHRVMSRYMEMGMRAGITTLGIPLSGQVFKLCDEQERGIKAAACGSGVASLISRAEGMLFYHDICELIEEGGWTTIYDEKAHATYSYKKKQWISYEDMASMKAKVDYVVQKGYAGVMVNDLSQDDFSNHCGGGRFPLVRLLANELNIPPAKAPPLRLVVCFFPSWGKSRVKPYSFHAETVNPGYCSHIIWSFAAIKDSGVLPATKSEKAQLKDLVDLKNYRPTLQVLASVGTSKEFDDVVRSKSNIEHFARSCGDFVVDNELDGIDIAWQGPTASQREQYTELITAVRAALQTRSDKLMLSVTVGGNGTQVEHYDIKQISEKAHIVNVATYNLVNAKVSQQRNNTALPARLFSQDVSGAYDSVEGVIKYYSQQGLDLSKSTMGIALYGRTYKLCDVMRHGVGAATCGPGLEGDVSRQSGLLFYHEACKLVKSDPDWVTVYDPEARVPYSFHDDQWISHENIQSIGYKVTYMKAKGLAGAHVWEISHDDFRGDCGDGRYPLLKILADALDVVPRGWTEPERQTGRSTPHATVNIVLIILILVGWTILRQ